jgi:photosystem II stability/assembly factor-like uncharacterized protein
VNLAAAAVLSAVQLLSSQTDFDAHFRTIGPHVGRDTAVDDVFFLDRLHGWVVVWYVDTVRARLYRTSDGGRTWRSVEVASHGVHAGASARSASAARRRCTGSRPSSALRFSRP